MKVSELRQREGQPAARGDVGDGRLVGGGPARLRRVPLVVTVHGGVAELPASEWAAWTALSRVLFNLDDFINRN